MTECYKSKSCRRFNLRDNYLICTSENKLSSLFCFDETEESKKERTNWQIKKKVNHAKENM